MLPPPAARPEQFRPLAACLGHRQLRHSFIGAGFRRSRQPAGPDTRNGIEQMPSSPYVCSHLQLGRQTLDVQRLHLDSGGRSEEHSDPAWLIHRRLAHGPTGAAPLDRAERRRHDGGTQTSASSSSLHDHPHQATQTATPGWRRARWRATPPRSRGTTSSSRLQKQPDHDRIITPAQRPRHQLLGVRGQRARTCSGTRRAYGPSCRCTARRRASWSPVRPRISPPVRPACSARDIRDETRNAVLSGAARR